MFRSNLHALSQPETATDDPLHDLNRQGVRDLISSSLLDLRLTGVVYSCPVHLAPRAPKVHH
mgnify:CR=1 FL=1